jgi:hypothetical protein
VEELDAIAREFQRIDSRVVANFDRSVDLVCSDAQAVSRNIQAVEFFRRLDQRRVTAPGDIVRAAASISADTSRFMARKASKRVAKSAALLSRRRGIVVKDSLGVKSKSPNH